LKELIALLLEKDLKKRLGCLKGGASDIKRHKFFSSELCASCVIGSARRAPAR
jgi:hypothetical protein